MNNVQIGGNIFNNVADALLDTVRQMGGKVPEKRLRAVFFRECRVSGSEYSAVVNWAIQKNRIVAVKTEEGETVIYTPEKYEKVKSR